MNTQDVGTLVVQPLTPSRWDDFETLFGSAAIPGRCWCMWWRSTQQEARANAGAGNRDRMRSKVDVGEPVGLLAYLEDRPVGWCSVGPRESFGRIERSPALTPTPGHEPPAGTWSTVCYFVHRQYRRRGVAVGLLHAAVEFAGAHGATAFEGYPVGPRDSRLDNNSVFPGAYSMYLDAGFTQIPSRAPDRSIQVIMRRVLR